MKASCPVPTDPLVPQGARPVSRWLTVVSHTDPRYGGLSSAVPRLGQAVARAGPFQMKMAAFCAPEEQVAPAGFKQEDVTFWPISRRPWLLSSSLRRRFGEEVRQSDGVHLHGLWEASTAMGSRTARRLGKPYLVSAHGMLEPWALANKRVKKWIYAHLAEHRVVAEAACLHALTRAEAEQYRRFGARAPIAVVPNAVDVPERLCADAFFKRFPELGGKRLIVFLGRLHPKKGLDLLIDAWTQLGRGFPEAQLVVAGPDAEGTRAKLDAALTAAGMENRVTFTGMLDPTMKWSALAAAEIFVLPSYSEGLPMGVLEAMGAGVPAIVTQNCNLPEIAEYRVGWEIEANAAALSAAIQEALEQSPQQNQVTGRRGCDLVTKRYNSRHVAQAMAEVYGYVLSGIPPKTVELL